MRTKMFLSAIVMTAVALSGCKENKPQAVVSEDGLLSCDYNTFAKEDIELPLSKFVENCEAIRFENSDSALFKGWMYTVTDNYIGIRQQMRPFLLFDRKGKYLCKVGNIGNGPGEYAITIYDEIIDEKNGRIFLAGFNDSRIMVYGLDGKWIKDIDLPFRINKPKLHLNEDGTLAVVHMTFSEMDPIAFCIDMDGNITKQVTPSANMIVRSFDGEIFSFEDGRELVFQHTSNDTVLAYNTETNRLEPRFAVSFSNPAPIHVYRYVPQGCFANCYWWDEENNRPKDGNLYFIDRETRQASTFHFVNDFFGNMPANPYAFNKGYYAQCLEPAQLIETVKEHIASGNCPDADKAKLEKLIEGMSEDDNNVILIGKLKSEEPASPSAAEMAPGQKQTIS